MMMKPYYFLLGLILFQFAYGAYAEKCENPSGGSEITCPAEGPKSGDDVAEYCCYDSNKHPYCCTASDYLVNNTGILVGLLVGILVAIILIICCCCFLCRCCPLAKRRLRRGTVLSD